MNKSCLIVLVFVNLFIFGCKEEYFPEIDQADQLLVVDGLLSDEMNVIKVNLSNAAPFRDHAYLPETGATVIVSNDAGGKFPLSEKAPGYYESKTFNFEYGRAYTLVIRTKKNKYYKSTPQTLFPKSDMEDIASTIKSNTLQTSIDGELVSKTFQGLEFSSILKTSSDGSSYFRFSNTIIVEYTEKIKYARNDSVTENFYCWKKYFPNEFLNLNQKGYNNLEEHLHNLAFCPIDSNYFSMGAEEIWQGFPPALVWTYYRNFYYFVITVKKYRINEDVHKYYKNVNSQLEAKNRIFDPISFQVKGNMSCDNDPEEAVLGVFEVSSASFRTYSFSDFLPDKSIIYKEEVPLDMDNLSDSGKVYNNCPPFWIYNY